MMSPSVVSTRTTTKSSFYGRVSPMTTANIVTRARDRRISFILRGIGNFEGGSTPSVHFRRILCVLRLLCVLGVFDNRLLCVLASLYENRHQRRHGRVVRRVHHR